MAKINFLTPEIIESQISSSFKQLVEKGEDLFSGFSPSSLSTDIGKISKTLQLTDLSAFTNLSTSLSLSTTQLGSFYKGFGYTLLTAQKTLKDNPVEFLSNLNEFLNQNSVATDVAGLICDIIKNPYSDFVGDIKDFFSDIITSIENFDIEKALSDFINSIDINFQLLAKAFMTVIDNIVESILKKLNNLITTVTNTISIIVDVAASTAKFLQNYFEDAINEVKNLFSEENIKKLKAQILSAFKNTIEQFENITEYITDLLSFQICKSVSSLEEQANKQYDAINEKIAKISQTEESLKASSQLELVPVVEAKRQEPDDDSRQRQCAEYKNKLSKIGQTALQAPNTGQESAAQNGQSSPVVVTERNKAILGQKSKHWTLADVSLNVTGTRVPIKGHNNLRYKKFMSTEELCQNGMHVLVNILDPLAEMYGKNNIIVLSGFRTVAKAKACGAIRSQHTAMEALDIRFRKLPFDKYLDRIKEILKQVPYDQAICEYVGYYQAPWLHISIKRPVYGANRFAQLSYIRRSNRSFVTRNPRSGSGYQPGLIDGSFVFSNPKASVG